MGGHRGRTMTRRRSSRPLRPTPRGPSSSASSGNRGRIGALALPDDVPSLVAAIEHGLELARQGDIVERCRAAAEPFDWETSVAPRLEQLYAGTRVR